MLAVWSNHSPFPEAPPNTVRGASSLGWDHARACVVFTSAPLGLKKLSRGVCLTVTLSEGVYKLVYFFLKSFKICGFLIPSLQLLTYFECTERDSEFFFSNVEHCLQTSRTPREWVSAAAVVFTTGQSLDQTKLHRTSKCLFHSLVITHSYPMDNHLLLLLSTSLKF